MEIDWSSPLIGWGIFIILIGLMASFLFLMLVGIVKMDETRTKPRHESERHFLILPRIYLAVSLMFFVIPPMTLYIFVEYFRGRHRMTSRGLEYGRVFGTGGHMNWVSIRSVRYVQWPKWFRLESSTGEVARVSSYVRDISEFARVVLKNVPASSMDEQTTQILKETAVGSPPPMSGHWKKEPD